MWTKFEKSQILNKSSQTCKKMYSQRSHQIEKRSSIQKVHEFQEVDLKKFKYSRKVHNFF